MNRLEFIQSLRKELRKLPPEEVVAATEFYEEYFDDALESLDTDGMTEEEAQKLREETEASLINKLGSPKSIGKQIRAEYASRILEGEEPASGEKVSVGHKISAIWWVIIGICSAPVSIPLALGLCCAVFALITGIFTGIGGIIAGVLVAFIGGAGLILAGFGTFSTAVTSGIMFIGLGMMLMAASAAAAVGLFLGVKALIRVLVRLWHNISEDRKKRNTIG